MSKTRNHRFSNPWNKRMKQDTSRKRRARERECLSQLSKKDTESMVYPNKKDILNEYYYC